MNYTIKPGNIAAVCNVMHDGKEQSFIYMAPNRIPVTSPHESTEEFNALPLAVRASVNKHFGTIFALPVDRRGEYLKSLQPWDVVGHTHYRDNQDLCHTCGKEMQS